MWPNKDTKKIEIPLMEIQNEYFTPEISDIRVGYECEITFDDFRKEKYNEWVPIKVFEQEYRDIDLVGYSNKIYYNKIRVPYLTGDQIMKEGWVFIYKNYGNLEFSKWDTRLSYRPETNMLSISRTDEKPWKDLFYGECKDINTFRYINKLLGI